MAKMPCTFYEKRIKPGTKHYQGMVSSIIRTIFAQNDQESAREQLRHVVDELKKRFPKAMKILEEAEEEILAYMAFPREHGHRYTPPILLRDLTGKFAVERMLLHISKS